MSKKTVADAWEYFGGVWPWMFSRNEICWREGKYATWCHNLHDDYLVCTRNQFEDYGRNRSLPTDKPKSIYHVDIKGASVDVYDVLKGFGVTCPAMQHAIKKMLKPGERGAKDSEQDKREAIKSIERSIELGEGL